MVIHAYLIELSFDHDDLTAIDHEGIRRNISGFCYHLNNMGVFASQCDPPTLVEIVSIKALANQHS